MKIPIKILIVEDEFTTIDNLIDSLEEVGYEIAGFAMTAEKALTILDKKETDLAILDIRLKGEKTGIWLGEQIRAKYNIPFIYLSAFSDKATIKVASQTAPATYLVKPFVTADIYAAIEMALINFVNKERPPTAVSSKKKPMEEMVINDHIFVKEKKIFKKIQLKDILYMQAFKNYVELTLANHTHIIRHTLQDFLKMLPVQHFMQTHRSFVVNVNQIEQIDTNAIRIHKHTIPISASFKSGVMERLKFFY